MISKRYTLICVAPGIPSAGSYDDPDEAIVACDAYHDAYDRETDTFITATCREEYEAAVQRWAAKRAKG